MDYKTIDLFCGAGGFSLGFEMAGFKTSLAIDKWDHAINTFNHNRDNQVGISIDINEFDNDRLKALIAQNDITGIIGGPPCQGFSMVGTRDESDDRNSLYLQYVRFVEVVRPKFFILENVKGLLNLKKGHFKDDIIERFSGLGYNVTYKLLKASDYGVPQNRERVFFVGLRNDVFNDTFFAFPKGHESNSVSTSQAISDLPSLDNGDDQEIYKTEPQNDYQQLMRNNSDTVSNNEITNHTEQTKNIISLVPDGGSIKDIPEEYYTVRNYNTAFKRMDSEKPSTTIDCGHRNYFHYKENRVPTVRESARIQSFPDDYYFTGSKTSQYTQVGNAVPPLLAKQIAQEINKLLEVVQDEQLTLNV
ncbi:DNA cytosine methyltransferase [Aquibacillus halophilus]|nr:DNA cytosine methyltransferase [Aquibacillus halophilus]